MTKELTDPHIAATIYTQYLGVLNLLGTVADSGKLDDYPVDRVFEDANRMLKEVGSCFRFIWSSATKTYSAEAKHRESVVWTGRYATK